MSELQQTQHEFLAFLLNGDPAIGRRIVDQAPVGRDTRLGIYANAYRMRLKETLEVDHEHLGLYLGDDLWDQLSDGYISDHPSRFRSLRQYGDALPDWLRTHEPFSAYPQIAELARFERRLLTAFDAADSPHATPADLARLAPEQWPGLRLRFHPSVQPFDTRTNCVPIWQALKQQQTPPDPTEQPANQPLHWLLWRGEDRLTQFRAVAPAEAQALQQFLAGADFATVCEELLTLLGEQQVAAAALEILSEWLQHGLVRDLVVA